jgi:phosphatidylinositol-bisphosphatase
MSNFIPGAFPTTAPSSTTAVSFKTASSVSLSDSAAYPGSGPPPKKRDNQAYIQEQMLLRRAEFIRQKRIRIKIGSWNVAAIQGCERDLSDWIVDKKRDMRTISLANYVEDEADMANGDDVGIYVIALQEVVDVTATENFIKYTDPKISLNWKAHAQVFLSNMFSLIEFEIVR